MSRSPRLLCASTRSLSPRAIDSNYVVLLWSPRREGLPPLPVAPGGLGATIFTITFIRGGLWEVKAGYNDCDATLSVKSLSFAFLLHSLLFYCYLCSLVQHQRTAASSCFFSRSNQQLPQCSLLTFPSCMSLPVPATSLPLTVTNAELPVA